MLSDGSVRSLAHRGRLGSAGYRKQRSRQPTGCWRAPTEWRSADQLAALTHSWTFAGGQRHPVCRHLFTFDSLRKPGESG